MYFYNLITVTQSLSMTVILFLAILVALILVHEFGHFLVAKWARIRVDEFGIGFPPRLFGRKRGETLYSVNALPLGGFVKIFGEDPSEAALSGPDAARSFIHKPKIVQLAVLVAGVFGNIILAWLLLSLGFTIGMPTALEQAEGHTLTDVRLVTTSVLPDSPAEKAGFLLGDSIQELSVGQFSVRPEKPEDVAAFVSAHGKEDVTVLVSRDDRQKKFTVQPKVGVIANEPEVPAIGIAMGVVGTLTLPPPLALIEGAQATGGLLRGTVVGLYHFVVQALAGAGDFSQITGPVGIVGLVGDASALGFIYLLSFTALISVNLAVINLLPFPSLDGGRFLFVIIEAMKGSAIKPAIANTVNAVGFILLILLMLAVTYHDIVKLVTS